MPRAYLSGGLLIKKGALCRPGLAEMMNTEGFSRFLKERSLKSIKENTVMRYIAQLDVMVRKYGLAPESITVPHLRTVFDKMELECHVATMNYRKMVLKLWLEFNDIEPDRELKRLLRSKSGESKRKIYPKDLLTLQELEDIVQHTRSPALRALWMCLYDTGCRPGGLCGMDLSDVLLDQRGAVLHFRKTKTEASKRAVRLFMPLAIQYLEQWLAVHPRRNDPEAPLFINGIDERFKSVSLTIQLKKYHQRRLGRGDGQGKAPLNLYLFRKTRATVLLNEFRARRKNSLDESEIKLRLGHTKHSRMLERYYDITDATDQEKAELRHMGLFQEESEVSETVFCQSCGAPNVTGSDSCQRCRLPFTEAEMLRQRKATLDEEMKLLAHKTSADMLKEILEDPNTMKSLALALSETLIKESRRKTRKK